MHHWQRNFQNCPQWVLNLSLLYWLISVETTTQNHYLFHICILVNLFACLCFYVFISLRQLVFVCFEPWQHSWRDFPLRSKALVSPQNVFVFACPVFLWHSLNVAQDLSYFSLTTTDKSHLRGTLNWIFHPLFLSSTTKIGFGLTPFLLWPSRNPSWNRFPLFTALSY